jgi:hypothetical protein
MPSSDQDRDQQRDTFYDRFEAMTEEKVAKLVKEDR